MVMSLTLVLGAGRVGPAGASLWLGSLLVLNSKLLGWEEVFFPVEATFGNWPGPAPFPFPSVLHVDACLAWPSGQIGAPSKEHMFFVGGQGAPAHCL